MYNQNRDTDNAVQTMTTQNSISRYYISILNANSISRYYISILNATNTEGIIVSCQMNALVIKGSFLCPILFFLYINDYRNFL